VHFPELACVSLEVRGPDELRLDQLHIVAKEDGSLVAFIDAHSPAVAVPEFGLPVVVAMVLDNFAGGFYTLRADALRDGVIVASGLTSGFAYGTATTFGGRPVHGEQSVTLGAR
jgi:hypothetical protein